MSDVPFRFGLERVRELRVHAEERAKEELAASIGQRLRGEALLRAAEQRLHAALDGRVRDAHDGVQLSGPSLVAQQAFVERLERTKAGAQQDLRRCDEVVDEHRQSLTAASQRREVLERLRERRREEHVREASRRDAIALDEMALQVHARGGMVA